MKTKITNSPIVKVITVILTALVIIYAAWTVSNTFQAYEIISENYDTFNYPNTVKVHSGTIFYDDDGNLLLCKISAENAYGQRGFDSYLASDDSMASFTWYEEYGFPVTKDMKKKANSSNVSETLLNFLIWKDWV